MQDMHFFEEKCCNIVAQAPSATAMPCHLPLGGRLFKVHCCAKQKLFFAIVFYTLKADIRRLFIIEIKNLEKHSTFAKKCCLIR